MSGTIAGTYTMAITLASSSGAYVDPLSFAGSLEVSVGNALAIQAPWTVENSGVIDAANGLGVSIAANATLHNTGTILALSGAEDGVRGVNARTQNVTIAITNDGAIEGGSMGVRLVALGGDMLDNGAAGTISGGAVGADLNGAPGASLGNYGLITSDGGIGALLYSAVAVNHAGGTISGGSLGVSLGAGADLINDGTVSGRVGIAVSNGNTIIDSSLIEGSSGVAVSFAPDAGAFGASPADDSMTLLPGASIGGMLEGNNVANLYFAGTSTGTLANFTSVVSGFNTIEIEAGSAWDLAGHGALSGRGTLENDGTVILSATDNLNLYTSLDGTGSFDLEGGTLALNSQVGAGQTFHFDNANASSLSIGRHGTSFAGTIDGFTGSDFLDITGFGSTAEETSTFANNTLTLTGSTGPVTLAFRDAPASLAIEPVTVMGTKSYEVVVPCFAAGTQLLTEDGYRAVESLRKGDRLITRDGPARPIVWRGRRRVDCRRHPRREAVAPIRIEAGAFGPGVPMRDLILSPDHAVFWGGVLIPAQFLVNGVSVRREDVPFVTYHHIELDRHDLVWAENLVTESYLDCGNRENFAGQGGVETLHADFAPVRWNDTDACAPLAVEGGPVTAARLLLHAGLHRRGYRTDLVDVALETQDGQHLQTARDRRRRRRLHVDLPDASGIVRFRSMAGCAADTDAASADRRQLGVALSCVALDGKALDFNDPRFISGFHASERGPRARFAWTDGDGVLRVEGARRLSFSLQARARVWQADVSAHGADADAEAGRSSARH